MFYAHIVGMDAFAQGLKIAHKMLQDGKLEKFVEERYSSYKEGIGADIVAGKVGFKELEKYALSNNNITNQSGRQEVLESIVNQYILHSCCL